MTGGPDGNPVTIDLGPSMTIQYQCRYTTMAALAGLSNMFDANVGPNPVLNETALDGRWNFDVKWSLAFNGPLANSEDRITILTAVEKQLGLKLESRQVPTPVIAVDSVNETARPDAPDVAEKLPAMPAEFDVAEIKPTAPDFRGGRYQLMPGGRVVIRGRTLRSLIQRAWSICGYRNTNYRR